MTKQVSAGPRKPWSKPELKSISAGSAEKSRNDENIEDGQGGQKS